MSGPRAFWPVVTVVAVVIAPFLRGDHHCDVVWWSGGWSLVEPLGTWSGGLVVGARRSYSGCGRRGRGRRGRSSAELLEMWSTWSRSTWSELGGATRDVVDVVAVDVVGARRSCSRCGRHGLVVGARQSRSGRGRRGLVVGAQQSSRPRIPSCSRMGARTRSRTWSRRS